MLLRQSSLLYFVFICKSVPTFGSLLFRMCGGVFAGAGVSRHTGTTFTYTCGSQRAVSGLQFPSILYVR